MQRLTATLTSLVLSFGLIGLMGLSAPHAAPAKKWQLRWKVEPGKPLAYKTSLDVIHKSLHIAIPLAKIAAGGSLPHGAKKQIRRTKPAANYSATTLLQAKSKQKIEIKMIQTGMPGTGGSVPKKHAKRIRALMKRMIGSVQLRGEITPSGKILSFWLQRQQKNILALLFELPKRAVKVGDSWPLHVNLIGMGANIRPQKAQRTNRATLVSVRKSKLGEVAIVYTAISEIFRGTQSSIYAPKGQVISYEIGFFGYGEFLIKQGRWKKLIGRMLFNSTGMMKRRSQSRFELLPLSKIPPKLLKIK